MGSIRDSGSAENVGIIPLTYKLLSLFHQPDERQNAWEQHPTAWGKIPALFNTDYSRRHFNRTFLSGKGRE